MDGWGKTKQLRKLRTIECDCSDDNKPRDLNISNDGTDSCGVHDAPATFLAVPCAQLMLSLLPRI